ncbi:hydroxyethylthiazole kinase [Halanaerocella petrolearia]
MNDILAEIKAEKPLVHHITNNVTVNDCANITLYWGGLPIMAYAQQEVEQMVTAASALVINIGTLNHKQIDAMLQAGKKANQLKIPVILDPVGVGATDLRTEAALEILNKVDIAVIKGNEGEITVLAGGQAKLKGVESVGTCEDITDSAQKLARVQDTVVVVSGADDIVTDGQEVYKITNGHPLMGQVVGTGCMLGSTLGVFCGVNNNYLNASLQAVAAYGIAGEKASQETSRPASYKVSFLDNISEISDQYLKAKQEVIEIN